MITLTTCSTCPNRAEVHEGDTIPLCDWCAHSKECRLPRHINISQSRITGNLAAECQRCYFRASYWDCACDLGHDCEGNQ